MMATRVLVDIGNTSTCVGIGRGRRVAHFMRFPTGEGFSAKVGRALRRYCRPGQPIESVLCSVVPSATPGWNRELRRVCGHRPLVVSHRLDLGVKIDYPRPETIGADRLANASAALFRYGAPVIVADFGTALTFDIVDDEACYVGGVIAPGLPLMTDYLAERTALLPRIRLSGACGAIGRSTAGAMRIGARVGYQGMVREIVHYLQTKAGLEDAKLCATGGYAEWALKGVGMPFTVDACLTVYGLMRIHDLNR